MCLNLFCTAYLQAAQLSRSPSQHRVDGCMLCDVSTRHRHPKAQWQMPNTPFDVNTVYNVVHQMLKDVRLASELNISRRLSVLDVIK